MPDRKLLVATRSSGKMRELRQLVSSAGYEAVDLPSAGIAESPHEDSLETGNTFEENALAKARHFHALTGLPTLADDSGIEVAALGGEPGVFSKRWSNRPDLNGQALDDANNRLLLDRLKGSEDRSARYVCVAAFVSGDVELVARGEVAGSITTEPRGSGGFGYDPFFLSLELGRTFAEVSMEEKSRVSHRARAVTELLARLTQRR